MNIQTIIKAISTSDFTNNAGRLNAKQADKFIDYMVENNSLLQKAQVIRMVADRQDLDYIGIGSRILRKGVEATAPTDLAGVTHTKRQLSVTEVILPFDISFSYLEDNIEGANIQDKLMRLFAQQYSNDLCDLAINGLGTGADPFLSIEKGWLALMKDSDHTGTHIVDTASSTDYLGVVFPALVAAMPEKWKRNPAQIELMVSPEVEEKYRLQLTARNTALGDAFLATDKAASYLGYKVNAYPYIPNGVQLFGNPKNLAVGIHARDMRVGKQIQERKRIVEVTITSRLDFEVVMDDQVVLGYDVA